MEPTTPTTTTTASSATNTPSLTTTSTNTGNTHFSIALWMQPNDIAQSGRRPIFAIGPTCAGTTISTTTTPPPSPQQPQLSCDGDVHLRLVQLYSHFVVSFVNRDNYCTTLQVQV
jgi:hypothetical protein